MSAAARLLAPSTASTSGRVPPHAPPCSPRPALQSRRAATRRSAASSARATSRDHEVVGVVVVDHGSRRKESNEMLGEFCDLYKQVSSRAIVEVAHMEIAQPSIEQAVGSCVEQGATSIVVAPYFLSRGRHIQDDIPALVASAREQYPSVKISIAEPIGIDPLMANIIESRVQAALEPGTTASTPGTSVTGCCAAHQAVG